MNLFGPLSADVTGHDLRTLGGRREMHGAENVLFELGIFISARRL